MAHLLAEIAAETALVTGFVLVMMLLIEYLDVWTRGRLDRVIGKWRGGQSALGAFLGATPGCLGAFAMASLFIHGVATFGSLVATMVATCGDEAFVMLALFPRQALLLFLALGLLGLSSGLAVDLLGRFRKTAPGLHLPPYRGAHEDRAECRLAGGRALIEQWRRCSPHRGWLTLLLVLFLAALLSGRLEPAHVAEWKTDELSAELGPAARDADAHAGGTPIDWDRATLLAATLFALFAVLTAPDHFLDEHLWGHVVRVHLLPLALWTAVSLGAAHAVTARVDFQAVLAARRIPVLLFVCLVGLIPASGPHLFFVALFARGAIPFSTLLASSIVQDGHAMIPILAHSRRAFVAVKTLKLAMGLAVGALGYAMGW